MARATIGESGADKAMNRMEKHLERSARRGDKANKVPTLLEQIQAAYPDTWQEEIREMKREKNDPEYFERKKAVKEKFKAEYWNTGRVERENLQLSEGQFIARKMRVWMEENK
jgi:hypothetical protein